MAARPFRAVGVLPTPLTVEETAQKFGVSAQTVEAAKRILAEEGRRPSGSRRLKVRAAKSFSRGTTKSTKRRGR
jgi:hypothetical protein